MYIHYHTILSWKVSHINLHDIWCKCPNPNDEIVLNVCFVASLEYAIEYYIGNIFNIIGSHVNIPGMLQQGLLSS